MKILIPETIRKEVNLLQKLQLISHTNNKETAVEVSLRHIESYNFVHLHDALYDSANLFSYQLIFANGERKTVNFPNKQDILYQNTKEIFVSNRESSSKKTNKIRQWCTNALNENFKFEQSSTKNAIVTFSSTERRYITKQKIKYLESIAKEWNCDLLIYRDPSDLLNHKQIQNISKFKSFRQNILNYVCKLLSIHNALKKYDRVLWLDDTCIITPYAFNPFCIVPEDSIGALVLPKETELGEPMFDFAFLKQRRGIDIQNAYCNNGVLVVPSCYRDIFSLKEIIKNKDLLVSPYPTQAIQNYLMQLHECKLFDITALFNLMPCHYHYDVKNWKALDITTIYPELLQYCIVHFTSFHKNRKKFHREFLELTLNNLKRKITVVILATNADINIDKFVQFYETIPIVKEILLVYTFKQDTEFEFKTFKTKIIKDFQEDLQHIDHIAFKSIENHATYNEVILLKEHVKLYPANFVELLTQANKNSNLIVSVCSAYFGNKKAYAQWKESSQKFTSNFIPKMVYSCRGKVVHVRCEEGFGNQLRMLLAGNYLVEKGHISEYNQEWTISNHNNVDYLKFFEAFPLTNLKKVNKSVDKDNILRAATFSGMLYHYAGIEDWSSILREQMNCLIPLNSIRETVNLFVEDNNIKNALGIHVRRTCKLSLLASSHIQRHNIIDNGSYLNFCSKESNVFLATDNKETQQFFIDSNPSCLSYFKLIKEGAEDNLKGKYLPSNVTRYTKDYHAILDFLILRECRKFVGSNESSFSLLLYYWRNKKNDYPLIGSV